VPVLASPMSSAATTAAAPPKLPITRRLNSDPAPSEPAMPPQP
jgi:hypothetical protein